MNNNEQREELVREIFITDNARSQDPAALWDEADHEQMHYAEVIADGLIAAGYRKPHTITTVEELDALPGGSVIHSGEGAVFEKCHSGWIETGRGGVMDPEDIACPATVIHEPTTEATP